MGIFISLFIKLYYTRHRHLFVACRFFFSVCDEFKVYLYFILDAGHRTRFMIVPFIFTFVFFALCFAV